jgi:hypothetical protein
MIVVREKLTKRAIYLLEDGVDWTLSARGLWSHPVKAMDIKPETHEVVEGVAAPVLWVGGALTYDDGWSVADQAAFGPVLTQATNAGREAAKASMIAWINDFLRPFTAGYPDTEVMTWPLQSQAARAFNDGEATKAQTAFLSGLALKRGLTDAQMADLIVSKANPYEAAVQETAGLRSATSKAIDAASLDQIPGILEQAQAAARQKAADIGLI